MEKKIFVTMLVAAIAFMNSNLMFSQSDGLPKGDVTLNIKLNPIQTIVVNGNQKVVDLVYTTKSDYENGVSETKDNHLTIYSTGGYEIKVNTLDETFKGPKTGLLNVNTVGISAVNGTNAQTGATYTAGLTLSKAEQVLASSSTGGIDKNITVIYQGKNDNQYLNFYEKAGGTPSVYYTTVTYTILAK